MNQIIARRINQEEQQEIDGLAREALKKVAQHIPASDEEVKPEVLLQALSEFVDKNEESDQALAQQLSYEMGSLFGKLVEAKYGWQWFHLTDQQRNMLYAIAPESEAFCCPVHEYFYTLLGDGCNNNMVFLFNLMNDLDEEKSHTHFEFLS